MDKTVAHYGKLDGVVSNAGIGMGGTPLHEYEVEDYREDLLPEQRGRLCRDEVRCRGYPEKPQRGRLPHQCGIGGRALCPSADRALYSATKFGVVGMTRSGTGLCGIRHHRQRHLPRLHQDQHFSEMHRLRPWTFRIRLPGKADGRPGGVRRTGTLPCQRSGTVHHRRSHPGGRRTVCRAPEHQQLEASGNFDRRQAEQPEHHCSPDGNEAAKAIVEQYLPGFAENQQAKAAYGMTFGKIGPMLGLPETALKALLDALDNL